MLQFPGSGEGASMPTGEDGRVSTLTVVGLCPHFQCADPGEGRHSRWNEWHEKW